MRQQTTGRQGASATIQCASLSSTTPFACPGLVGPHANLAAHATANLAFVFLRPSPSLMTRSRFQLLANAFGTSCNNLELLPSLAFPSTSRHRTRRARVNQ